MKQVTSEEFDRALDALVSEMSATDILAIPGIYELLCEALNNEAIERAIADRDEESEQS